MVSIARAVCDILRGGCFVAFSFISETLFYRLEKKISV